MRTLPVELATRDNIPTATARAAGISGVTGTGSSVTILRVGGNFMNVHDFQGVILIRYPGSHINEPFPITWELA